MQTSDQHFRKTMACCLVFGALAFGTSGMKLMGIFSHNLLQPTAVPMHGGQVVTSKTLCFKRTLVCMCLGRSGGQLGPVSAARSRAVQLRASARSRLRSGQARSTPCWHRHAGRPRKELLPAPRPAGRRYIAQAGGARKARRRMRPRTTCCAAFQRVPFRFRSQVPPTSAGRPSRARGTCCACDAVRRAMRPRPPRQCMDAGDLSS